MTALILLGLILCVVTALAAFSPRGLLSWLLGLLGRESLLPPSSVKSDVEKKPSSESWPPIEPLPDFDWKTTPPIKLRPFKPIYHINMAIQSTTPSELIVLDNTYLTKVLERRSILSSHGPSVHGAISSGSAPVRELYTYLLGTYLPTRYPRLFSVSQTEKGTLTFHNHVTGLTAPVCPSEQEMDAEAMLRILGETVEDDLFLLLQDPAEQGGQHRAVAFVCCHPAGFAPREKLGMRLGEIHGPVPGIEKISGSMERFFSRLEVGKPVKRVNWTLQTTPHLFTPRGSGVTLHLDDAVQEVEKIDPSQARMRVELQTLTRLPQSRAILFSFKSFMYPLEEIKAEGLGPALADAVEGLQKGNVPGMWIYKGAVSWGKAMIEYLRE